MLLARAASYAKHRDNYSTLFQIATMEPLVAGPAFVRALEELVAAAKLGPADHDGLDVAAARRAFLAGQSALAIAWPGHAAATASEPVKAGLDVGFIELPGSTKVYSASAGRWDNRNPDESTRVPLLASAGRLGSVSAQ